MNTFLCSNKTQWRLVRTIVQGIIGVIIAVIVVVMIGLIASFFCSKEAITQKSRSLTVARSL